MARDDGARADGQPGDGPRVLFAGGGTGGHVCPAVAVARALAARAPGARVLFLGSGRPVERRILGASGLPYAAVPAAPRTRPLRFAWSQARGLAAAVGHVRRFRPDVVLGLGGFASVPGALAGRLAGAPLALFEPNALPGRANRWLARLAREAYAHWDEARLPCPVVRTGTPLGEGARLGLGAAGALTQAEARARLGLPPDRRTLLVTGGSQGARELNAALVDALARPEGKARLAGRAVVHLAGSDEAAAALRAAYAAAGVPAHVAAFTDEIGVAYRAADLALVRGGAATLAELLGVGLPAVVVPLRGVADDHQAANARAFARLGAGWAHGCEAGAPGAGAGPFDGAAALRALERLHDEVALARAAEAARAAGRPEAADAVARRLLALAGAPAIRGADTDTRAGEGAGPRGNEGLRAA